MDVCTAAGRGWEGVSPGPWLEVREGDAVCTPARRGEPGTGRKEGRRDHHTLTPEWKPGLLELRSCVGLTGGCRRWAAGKPVADSYSRSLEAGVRAPQLPSSSVSAEAFKARPPLPLLRASPFREHRRWCVTVPSRCATRPSLRLTCLSLEAEATNRGSCRRRHRGSPASPGPWMWHLDFRAQGQI